MTKVRDVVKRLTDDSWFLHGHGSKHDKYRHPTKPGQIQMPRHPSKELAKGTEHSILKAAGL